MNQQVNLVEFLKDFYEYPRTPRDLIVDEHQSPTGSVDTWERMVIEDGKGIFVYLVGKPYPVRGAPLPQAMVAINTVKRVAINILRLFPITTLRTFIHVFNRITWGISSPYILKHNFMNPVAKEFKLFSYNFLRELGISENQADLASKTVSHIFEYDNAYRYRLQDILKETSPQRMISFKELRRLGNLLYERDDALSPTNRRVGIQSRKIIRTLSWLLFIPKIRGALKRAVLLTHWENFLPDDADNYWMSQRKDYKFNIAKK